MAWMGEKVAMPEIATTRNEEPVVSVVSLSKVK